MMASDTVSDGHTLSVYDIRRRENADPHLDTEITINRSQAYLAPSLGLY